MPARTRKNSYFLEHAPHSLFLICGRSLPVARATAMGIPFRGISVSERLRACFSFCAVGTFFGAPVRRPRSRSEIGFGQDLALGDFICELLHMFSWNDVV